MAREPAGRSGRANGPGREPAAPIDRIGLRRVYDPVGPDDRLRILVDRLWPRGRSKAEARIDDWVRDVAPGGELRRWFGHDPDRWAEFRRRYRAELTARPEVLEPLLDRARQERVTLVYGARDEQHNQAVVLKEVLEERLGEATERTASTAPPN
jgi:uncharacterized protein YeaO (DUF488 family)